MSTATPSGNTGLSGTTDLSGVTAIVTGASRGFGRAITMSLAAAGAQVVGVARSERQLGELQAEIGGAFTPEVADVGDDTLAARLIGRHQPHILVLNAGAAPVMASIEDQTWESFSQNWSVDVKHVFHFVRQSLVAPLAPGATVVSMSSGAALRGSALSGGYAGAKATIRFVSAYAASEARRGSLGIRFVSVLPQLTAATGLGSAAADAYAKYEGLTIERYLERFGPPLSDQQVGEAVVTLAGDDHLSALAYSLTGQGLNPID
jgi:NAD(P)-dependent dehydrogenase (short-subunit alcohol dehydrogenase family)